MACITLTEINFLILMTMRTR